MSKLIEVNDEVFDAKVLGEPIALVDFSSSFCGPCARQMPILEQLADKHPDVKFFKVDISDCPETTSHYNIRSIPTLILFKDGKEVYTKTGLTSLIELESNLQKSLKN
jgi:thioredoxin 1